MRVDIEEATRKYYLSSLRACNGDRRLATIRTRAWLATFRSRNRLSVDAILRVSTMDYRLWEPVPPTALPTHQDEACHQPGL